MSSKKRNHRNIKYADDAVTLYFKQASKNGNIDKAISKLITGLSENTSSQTKVK